MNLRYKLEQEVVLCYNQKNINNGLIVRIYKTEISSHLGDEIKIKYCVQSEDGVRFSVEEDELQPLEGSVDLK